MNRRSVGLFFVILIPQSREKNLIVSGRLRISDNLPSCFLGSDDEMDHAIRRGDEEAVEILAQLLDLIAPLNTVHFQKCRGFLGVVCFKFQPNIRMTQVRDTVDPKAVWPELENAAVLFLLDQRQPERVPIKSNRLLISVAGTFDRDVPTA